MKPLLKISRKTDAVSSQKTRLFSIPNSPMRPIGPPLSLTASTTEENWAVARPTLSNPESRRGRLKVRSDSDFSNPRPRHFPPKSRHFPPKSSRYIDSAEKFLTRCRLFLYPDRSPSISVVSSIKYRKENASVRVDTQPSSRPTSFTRNRKNSKSVRTTVIIKFEGLSTHAASLLS